MQFAQGLNLIQTNELCLLSLVCPNHICNNSKPLRTSKQCLLINPLKFKVPPFLNSIMSLENYNELLKAVCENTNKSLINSIIRRHAILRGIRSNSAPLKRH